MAQLFCQTVPRHASWLLVGPPAATSLAPQQDITVTFSGGSSVVVPAGVPAALLGGGTTWDRTSTVVVGYVLLGSGTLLACPEAQLGTISTDYAPLVRVLADSVQVYQPQLGGSGETIAHNGTAVATRPALNLIDGSGVTLTVADNSASHRVDVTVASSGGGGATTVPYCAVSGTPNHTMAASGGCGAGPFGSAYVVPFPTTDTDQGTATAQHSTTSNTSRLTCQSAGVYLVTASAVGQSSKLYSTAGYSEQSASLVVVKNAAQYASPHTEFAFTDVAECVGSRFSVQGTASLSAIVPLSVGDYIEVWVGFFDNSGNNNDTLLVIGPTFAMVKVG